MKGAAAAPEQPSSPASPGKKKGKDQKPKAAFATRSARQMPMELLGEGTPGPGSYLPASSFGKYERGSEKQKQRNRPTSSFRSTSPARPKASNEHVPGPGAHSPNYSSLSSEKKRNNPANSMKAKGKRFGMTVGSIEGKERGGKFEPGPGDYNTHTHKTIQAYLQKKRQLMSRQNPGFGASSAAHTLPFEEEILNDQKAYREATSHANDHFIMGSSPTGRRPASGSNDLSA